jgi:sialate O-acetylesterase
MHRCLSFAAALAVGLGGAGLARADVKLAPLFTDNMVLQQGAFAPVWGTAEPGEEVSIVLDGGKEAVRARKIESRADQTGRWMLKLPVDNLGHGPLQLTVKGKNTVTLKNVLVGEVWVCSGQSNMEMSLVSTANAQKTIAAAANPNIRLFTVKRNTAAEPQTTADGKWVECTPDTVRNFSAVAYYFGRDLQKDLNVPVGLIHTSWGGTPAQAWTSKEALEAVPELRYYPENFAKAEKSYDAEKAQAKYKEDVAKWEQAVAKAKEENKQPPRKPQPPAAPGKSANSPSTLYNAMIAPLIPYGIKGAIWYQGESNAGRAYEYRSLFPTMIQDWRKRWGGDEFPFLFVQLAPYQKIVHEPGPSAWAELREAQLLTTKKLKNTAMAVITDVGEENDIHPKKKEPVGHRLELAALALAYGKPVEYSGPAFKSMTAEGDKAVLSFDHAGAGLEARGGALTGFTVAGKDGKFHNARAEVRGDRVVVWSPEVSDPAAVRYGWANYPLGNLWNKDGLPASPFRTDDLPITTGPKPTAGK